MWDFIKQDKLKHGGIWGTNLLFFVFVFPPLPAPPLFIYFQ